MEASQQALNKLNSVQAFTEKVVLRYVDLIIGKNYHIQEVKAVNTRYGRKIVVETEENTIFLPERYNILDDEEIENLKKMCNETLVMVKADKYNLSFNV